MQILTAFALLIPAFSLVYNPHALALILLLVHNAPLPNPRFNNIYHPLFSLSGEFGSLRDLFPSLHDSASFAALS